MIRNNRHKTEVLLSTAKRLILSVCMVAFPLSVCLPANGQIQLVGGIKTIAGDGTSGDTGNGSAATSAELDLPVAAAVDTAGNIYVADRNANVIREVSAGTGVITTVAGNGTAGFAGDGAAATSAELNQPGGVAVDTAGNIYIADFSNNRIRKVTVATGVITTVAGNGTAGFSGDAALATSAELNVPNGVAFDITGNLYIADDGNNRIRKVTIATGVITTVAGNGTAGFSGDAGVPTSAELHGPTSVAIDSTGDIYIADYYNNRIRMVNVITGLITTVAGDGTAGFLGDGGAATSAELNVPASVALDKGGNLYIADQSNNRIREVTLGVINTVAGDGVAGLSGNNGAATSAEVNAPVGVATDSAGDLYIADSGNSVIREVVLGNNFPTTNIAVSSAVQDIFLQTTAAETITSITIPQSQNATQEYSVGTISGCSVGGASNPAGTICVIPVTFTPAYPGQRRIPLQVVTSAGNINFGLQGMGVGPLATLTPGIITTVAGGGTVEGDGGVATSAALSNPYNATADSAGNLYIADVSDQRIRKVAAGTGIITTVAGTGTAGFSGDGGLATAAQLNNPSGVKVDSAGNLYIADGSNHRVRKVTAATGIITTVAGSGISNGGSLPTGQGGPATSAQMASPYDVAIDSAGNLFISDGTDNCIYKVAGGTGVLTKYAGTSCTNTSYNFSGDGGLATGAYLNAPCGINLDNQDNLYIADQTNERIRKITASTGIITTVAGNGAPAVGAQGDGGLATNGTFYQPCGIAIDNAGNLYIGDQFSKIRFVNAATGILSTIVGFGDANSGFSGDGGAATKAQVNYPLGVALDNQGNLYIGDYKNERIREVNMSLSQLTYPTATTVGTLDATDDPQKVIVQNVGNGSLTIPPPTTGSNLSVSTSFVFDSSSTCPQLFTTSASDTLISGQSCTYALDFEPTLAGSISGSAVLTDNSLNVIGSTQTINMSGTGLAVATTTQVTSSANPSAYTQSVTFTATVTPTTGTAVPTGTVQFKIGGVATGTPVTVGASGTATFTTSTLAVGSYSITAVYTPDDSTFTTSTATAINQVVNKATPGLNGVPAITVTSTPNPSNFNQSVTFTAAVPTGATGTVNFLDGTTLLGTGTISGTTATFTTTTLIVASHPVTGVYSGNANYNTATSAIDSQVVGKATLGQNGVAAITVASTPNPSAFSQSVTFTTTVPTGVTGTVSFMDGTTLLGTGTISGTTATYTTTTLAGGTHPVTAVYNGNANYNTATSAIDSQVVNKATLGQNGLAAITVASTPNPSSYSQSVTFTATVPTGPTGMVNFMDGTTLLGTGTIAGTTATFSTTTLIVGTHPVTAVYGGDTNYNTATSAIDSQVVNKATLGQNGVAAITVASSPNPSSFSQSVTFTATVPTGATGTVNFMDGVTLLGTGTISGTTATFATTTLIVGSHPVTGVYSGNANYNTATSAIDSQVVNKATLGQGGVAAITVVSAPNPSSFSQSVTFTATVPTGATGTVNFLDGTTLLGTGTITGTTATFTTTTLIVGSHPVTGVYSGNANFNTGTSAIDSQVVNKATLGQNGVAAISLASSPNPSTISQSVTFTATVPTGVTGMVNFMDGTTLLGTGTITGTTATFTTTTLTGGTHPVTAVYSGNTNYNTATSTVDSQVVNKATLGQNGVGNVTLASSPNPSNFNQSVTFTATVPTGVTGTVNFMDGTTLLGTGTITGTTATFTTTTLTGGTHPVTAVYSGDANYNPATSAIDNQTVNKATLGQNGVGNITLASSPNPSTYSQSVTFTAAVPTGVTGTVNFMDGTTLLGTGTITGTTATFTTTTLSVSTHPVTAVYSGNTNYNTATSTIDSQVVNKATTTLTAPSVSPLNAPFGTPVTITQTVPPGETGTVTFYNGSTPIGTGTIVNGVATLTTSALPPGTASITGMTSGDPNYDSATSPAAVDTIAKATPTLTAPTISPLNVPFGTPVTITQTVPPGETGTVTFYNGTTPIGTATIVNGVATLTTSSLPAGTASISAKTSGDANYGPGTSPATTDTIPKTTTDIPTFTINPTSPTFGQPTTVTITVPTTGATPPTGTVTIYDNGQPVGTGTVGPNGVVTVNLPGGALPQGTGTITVGYSGDGNYAPSTSAPQTVNVLPPATSTSGSDVPTFTVNPSAPVPGQPVAINVTVPPSNGATPTGTVTIYDNGKPIGTGTLNANGTVTVNLPAGTLPAGSDTITVGYNGDANNPSSTSAPQTINVAAAATDFVVGTTTPVLTTDPGSIAAFTITVAPITGNTFPNPVTLTVTGLPANFTASFAPLTVTPGSGTVTSQMSVQTFAQIVAALEQRQQNERYKYAAFSCMLLPLLGIRRLRKRLSKVGLFLVLGIATLGATTALTGCGGGYFGPAPASYPLTVTGTSGSLQHSTTVTLNVR